MLKSTLSSFRNIREYITPITHESSYNKTGQLTPEEFVAAGDYLVLKFPTWTWAGAPPSKHRDFLPDYKQVLVTKHLPSRWRASVFTGDDGNNNSFDETIEDGEADEEGWVSTSGIYKHHTKGAAATVAEPKSLNQEAIDIDLDLEVKEDDDQEFSQEQPPDRTYNLYITYSTSYAVPKIYLSGFNKDGNPLSPDEMFEDVVSDYRDKTVTIESAPFDDNLTLISIHPCRHANVMKILLDRATRRLRDKQSLDDDDESSLVTEGISKMGVADSNVNDDWEEIPKDESLSDNTEVEEDAIRVDQYLVIFLKFISSVIPGIEDNTMTLE